MLVSLPRDPSEAVAVLLPDGWHDIDRGSLRIEPSTLDLGDGTVLLIEHGTYRFREKEVEQTGSLSDIGEVRFPERPPN